MLCVDIRMLPTVRMDNTSHISPVAGVRSVMCNVCEMPVVHPSGTFPTPKELCSIGRVSILGNLIEAGTWKGLLDNLRQVTCPPSLCFLGRKGPQRPYHQRS